MALHPSPHPHDEYERFSEYLYEPEESWILSSHSDEVEHLLAGRRLPGHTPTNHQTSKYTPSWLLRPWSKPASNRTRQARRLVRHHRSHSRRVLWRKLRLVSLTFLASTVSLSVLAFAFLPGYTSLPPHYARLRQQVQASTKPGRGNPAQQKIFIAASIHDGDGGLAGGAWAKNVLDLIDLLGPENTYLSIYENDSGAEGRRAIAKLEERLPCKHKLVFEEHLAFDSLPQVTVPDGTKRVKRMAYLAEVRNRALIPLETSNIMYDKLLYVNDVVFDPADAVQLLLSTNQDEFGHADYRAACAVDFINPFKFYDTFATRDLGGFSMGVPFFPWFSYGGDPRSHQDVVDGSDAVRVRSCWGGMVAFDARFFQPQPLGSSVPETAGSQSSLKIVAPYRFRTEQDLFWDASECCLIQADIQSPDHENTGIYMNPYVRVAYSTRTLSWLWFTRRFERLYTPIHSMVDILVSLPRHNPRRAQQPWEQVEENVWVPDAGLPTGGSFQNVSRLAGHAGFCGRRKLPVMKPSWDEGENYYEFIAIP